MSAAVDVSRFVRFEAAISPVRWRVGAGNNRHGMAGVCLGVISLKHSPAYEVVLHLDNGKVDTFSPMQLFPEPQPVLPDPLGCRACTHPQCDRFDGPRAVECRAMADNACARPMRATDGAPA